MIDVHELRPQTLGKWPGIYQSFGIQVGDGKHGPCPICGGKDRFRFDDKTGMGDWICNQCGAGSGFDLIMKSCGKTFPEAVKTVAEIIGTVQHVEKKPELTLDQIQRNLNKVWKSSKLLTGSDIVSRYLHSRKLTLRPDNVMFCPECYEPETKSNMPAMVARVMDPTGKPITIHRTYLNGIQKADIKSTKKIMPGTATINGAAIRLFTPGGMFDPEFLGVAEGIETAIAATQKFQIATWSVLNANGMESFQPPEQYRKIAIFADNDANFRGQKAAYILANSLYLNGLIVEVQLPGRVGDWNDYD